MALIVALAALFAVLAFALARPHGWPEAVVAVPAAVLVVASGAVSWQDAIAEVNSLAPVVGFLAAILVLARLCADEGLFRAAGDFMARTTGGSQPRLLASVFGVAAVVTAVLSLDATVVLLTPVVLATARMLQVPSRPHAYATAHLANSASLLLPVSNLTNLLAFTAAGLTFLQFAAAMTLPWLIAVAAEFLLLRMIFASDLAVPPRPAPSEEAVPVPRFAVVVVAATLAGFAVTSLAGLSPGWAALAGAVVLGARSLSAGRSTVRGIVGALDIPFLAFVLCLGVVVDAVMRNGMESAMAQVIPAGDSLTTLLVLAAVSALLSNAVNNLPAVLVMLPLVEAAGPAAVLAVLIGVNVGPNLSYIGSLANLLWRRVIRAETGNSTGTGFADFSRVGLCTTPVVLVLSVIGLWTSARLLGL
ncbi:SLC13 family permease [Mycolicibacterium vaccae]|uniref:SLC13 family permease n=1 Tax=Mycolicibacterium vaccae TaxID=1810 RepID=UPI003D061DC8